MYRTLKQELGDPPEVHCSRERSRAAWKIIQEVWKKIVHKLFYYYIFIAVSRISISFSLLFGAVLDALCRERAVSDSKNMQATP